MPTRADQRRSAPLSAAWISKDHMMLDQLDRLSRRGHDHAIPTTYARNVTAVSAITHAHPALREPTPTIRCAVHTSSGRRFHECLGTSPMTTW